MREVTMIRIRIAFVTVHMQPSLRTNMKQER